MVRNGPIVVAKHYSGSTHRLSNKHSIHTFENRTSYTVLKAELISHLFTTRQKLLQGLCGNNVLRGKVPTVKLKY